MIVTLARTRLVRDLQLEVIQAVAWSALHLIVT